MGHTVFEYERPAAAPAQEEPAHLPGPVLLFRPSPRRLPSLPRGPGGLGVSLTSWISGWTLDRPDQSLSDRIFEGLTWGIVGICLAVWAVVGAVFWIPQVLRGVVLFSVHLLQAMLMGERPTVATQTLLRAITFYPRGFTSAVEAVRRTDPRAFSGFRQTDRLPRQRLVRELGWAVGAWYAVLLVVGGPVWSPSDAWHWVVGGAPMEVLVAAVDWLAGVLAGRADAGAGLPGVASLLQ
jgi:hypothetical protein